MAAQARRVVTGHDASGKSVKLSDGIPPQDHPMRGAAVGADFSHVAKITTYIVGYDASMRETYGAARAEAMGDALPASTLIGVQALAMPEYLIEVEAIAVV